MIHGNDTAKDLPLEEVLRRHTCFQSGLALPLAMPSGGLAPSSGRIEVSFLSRYFCLAGLPLRNPKKDDFHRRTDKFSLSINAPRLTLPEDVAVVLRKRTAAFGDDTTRNGIGSRREPGTFSVGVPFGAKARLLTVWLCSQAQDPRRSSDDRWLDIGPIKPWLSSIGLRSHGDIPSLAKDQLFKLTFASFTMQALADDLHLFSNEQLVEKAIFADRDLPYYALGELDKVRWPVGLQLTTTAYERFRDSPIAIPTPRLTMVSNSPMAIDVLAYLCYRLPLLSHDDDELVTWQTLASQFGSSEAPSRFRQVFDATLTKVMAAYPEANIEGEAEGLRIRRSDPLREIQPFISMASAPPQVTAKRKLRNRSTSRHSPDAVKPS
jgi:hypothetical protein